MDEELEKAIDRAGRDNVFIRARTYGWRDGPPPKFVWWGIVAELMQEQQAKLPKEPSMSEQLRKALEFYANKENYFAYEEGGATVHRYRVPEDQGQRAREALSALDAAGGGQTTTLPDPRKSVGYAFKPSDYFKAPAPLGGWDEIEKHLLTLEVFVGEVEHWELADDSTPDITGPADAIDAIRALKPDATGGAGEQNNSIYVASRASLPERSAMWRAHRSDGYPIISSWIDEAGEGETENYAELWSRIEREIASSRALLLYAETEDFPLKGALIEAGIALGMGKRVIVCLPGVDLQGRTMRPAGSWIAHGRVQRIDNIKDALAAAISSASSPAAVAGVVVETPAGADTGRAVEVGPLIPEGWQLVPKEPTEIQIAKGWHVLASECSDCEEDAAEQARRVYIAMSAAAPAAQVGK